MDEWNLQFVFVYCFMFVNNPLESTCTILGRICVVFIIVFLFPKALALERVPYLWTSICISLDFQLYIYDVFSSTYIVV